MAGWPYRLCDDVTACDTVCAMPDFDTLTFCQSVRSPRSCSRPDARQRHERHVDP